MRDMLSPSQEKARRGFLYRLYTKLIVKVQQSRLHACILIFLLFLLCSFLLWAFRDNNQIDFPVQGTMDSELITVAQESLENASKIPRYDFSKDPGLVHIFYYPWYGNPKFDGNYIHWNHELLPHWEKKVNQKYDIGKKHDPMANDLGSSFYPKLGAYSSKDPEIIEKHFIMLLEAGISVIAVSWHSPHGHGQESGRNDITYENLPILFEVAEKIGMRICFHLEPYDGRTVESTFSDLEYIRDHFSTSPAYYKSIRHENRPVFYVYDSYKMSNREWRSLFSKSLHNKYCVRDTDLDAIFLGLLLKPDDLRKHITEAEFDGFYTYFASDSFTYGSNPINWANWKDSPKAVVPSIGPGYDDEQVRPWNRANTKSRKRGDYYNRYWQKALDCNPSFVSITSFNEWHEGTQIEPAIQNKRDNGDRYRDYSSIGAPDAYMKITKDWVSKFYDKSNMVMGKVTQ